MALLGGVLRGENQCRDSRYTDVDEREARGDWPSNFSKSRVSYVRNWYARVGRRKKKTMLRSLSDESQVILISPEKNVLGPSPHLHNQSGEGLFSRKNFYG
jgi:hypothetical protein